MNNETSVESQLAAELYNLLRKIVNNQAEKNTACQLSQLTRRIERLEQKIGLTVNQVRTADGSAAAVLAAPGVRSRTEQAGASTVNINRFAAMPAEGKSSTLYSDLRLTNQTGTMSRPMAQTVVLNWKAREIIAAYNQLAEIADAKEAGEKRKEFFKQYEGTGLCCKNADERRQNAEIPIRLENLGSYGGADYWAFPYSVNEYLVFPRSGKQYEEAVHNTGGYKEVFDSDYVPGRIYPRFTVVQPAVFIRNAEWQLRAKGRLLLQK